MKTTYSTLSALGLVAFAPLATAQDQPAPAAEPAAAAAETAAPLSPEQVKAAFSYLMGHRFGQLISGDAPLVDVGDFEQAAFFKGMADSFENKLDPALEKDIVPAMQAFAATLEQRNKAQAAANLEAGKKFMEENGKKEGVVTTKSGLQYKVIKESRGMRYDEKKHGKSAECSVIYEGRLIDGKVFDSTDKPITMPINRVVPGFSEALKLMPVGSTYEVYIPAELGYGEAGPSVIGNNATLIFKITLTDITPARKSTQASPIELTPEMLKQLQEQSLEPVEPASDKTK